jgi:hypothetical protein
MSGLKQGHLIGLAQELGHCYDFSQVGPLFRPHLPDHPPENSLSLRVNLNYGKDSSLYLGLVNKV